MSRITRSEAFDIGESLARGAVSYDEAGNHDRAQYLRDAALFCGRLDTVNRQPSLRYKLRQAAVEADAFAILWGAA